MEMIIDNGGDPNHKWWREIHQNSPLLVAARRRNEEVARLLFEKGADVDWTMKQIHRPVSPGAVWNRDDWGGQGSFVRSNMGGSRRRSLVGWII